MALDIVEEMTDDLCPNGRLPKGLTYGELFKRIVEEKESSIDEWE